MLHPWGRVRAYFDEELASRYGPQGCCILSKEFYETDRARGFVRGYNIQVTRGPGPVTTARTGLPAGTIPWGAGHHEAFARAHDRTVNIGDLLRGPARGTQHRHAGPTLTDAHGIPAPKITYRMSENSRAHAAARVDRGTEAMRAAGAVDVFTEARCAWPAGTCWAPRAWAPTRSVRWSTNGAAATT
jgi:hypothetical protein